MKQIFAGLLTLSISVMANAALAQQQSAYESVKESTDILLKRLVEVQPIYETDPEKFYSEVESALEPYIDFEGFAKRVMAKYYRQATPAQQQTFIETFKTELIKTYSTALLEFDNEKVVVLPPDSAKRDEDRATITLEVHTSSGSVYPVQYQLGLEGEKWLLRNVVINGINIGLQFRSQFAAAMQRYGNDIDKVIDNWSVDVQDNG